MNAICIFRWAWCLGMALLVASTGARAETVVAAGADSEGDSFSAAMVEGRPAIAYRSAAHDVIKYVSAADGDGVSWQPPVMVRPFSGASGSLSLWMSGGNPAVCYFDGSIPAMKVIRAGNAVGTVWNSPGTVSMGAFAPLDCTIEVVSGNPAICYSDNEGVQFRRAGDATGLAWGPPILVHSGDFAYEPVVKVIGSRPAVVYTRQGGVWYQRADDASGSTWGEPVMITSDARPPDPHYHSLLEVNGRPSLSYIDDVHGNVMYVRAADAAGSTWMPPVKVDPVGVAAYPSLAVIDGKPAISYQRSDLSVNYVEAKDGEGATAGTWEATRRVSSEGDMRTGPALLEVDGLPAVVFHDLTHGSLHYIRAVTAGTSSRWPAELKVLAADGATGIPDGSTKEYGVVAVGTTATFKIVLSNPNSGSVAITGLTARLDGPDAGEFSLLQPPPGTLYGLQTTPVNIRYAPATPGLKSATLHIAGTAAGIPVACSITLTVSSVPDIAVEWPEGTVLTDGGTLFLSAPAAESLTNSVFTVRNPGGAELNGLAVTIDGPDAGDFSIFASLTPALAPGQTGHFTLRYATHTTGTKTMKLHISSNLAGSRNPFDLTLVYTSDALFMAGAWDSSFKSDAGLVTALAVQPDGKILAGGLQSLVRFTSSGSPDLGFFAPPVASGNISCMAVQKDGRILLGGDFTRIDGQVRFGLARLYPDGSLDETFDPRASASVYCLAVQSDGKILTGGRFYSIAGEPRRYLARLNPDGSIDSTFNCQLNDAVFCLVLQPDEKVIIGGTFTQVSGTPAQYIARLEPDGTPGVFSAGFNDVVECLAIQPDGRIFAGGSFAGGIARLFRDGTADPSVAGLANGAVHDFALQTDGRCLVAGTFKSYTDFPRNSLARIHADGSLDYSFDSKVAQATNFRRLAMQTDGRVLVAGDFIAIGGGLINNLARLKNDAPAAVLKTEELSLVRWLRTGYAPEVSDVTFELSTPGSPDWTVLGNGKRIDGGWELTGLSLPVAGRIRARGRAGGSLMETVSPVLTAIEAWRVQYFNTSSNTGDAADDADPDHDGLSNLVEFAFGLSPVEQGSNTLPECKLNGLFLTTAFTPPAGAEEVILYGAESSPSMLPETWTPMPDTGTGGTHLFSAAAAGERVFMRFVVKRR